MGCIIRWEQRSPRGPIGQCRVRLCSLARSSGFFQAHEAARQGLRSGILAGWGLSGC